MTAPQDPYVKLVIGLQDKENRKYLIALRTTADYYGWTEEFEPWTPKAFMGSDGRPRYVDPGRRGSLKLAGGKRLRICRSASTAGNPAGFTNAFRIAARCGKGDLAELAHFTKGDWTWMESVYGERIHRDHWEEIYQATSSFGGRGYVRS